LFLLLAASAAFAVWTWTRPYDWRPDPAAGCRVVAAAVERDRSYHWLELRLKVRPDFEHDLRKPVFLTTAAHQRLEPADTTLSGAVDKPIDEIFLKFWLEPGDLDGPITLHLNDGSLRVRSGSGIPATDSTGRAQFTTHRW
jgi:hypothetical protein